MKVEFLKEVVDKTLSSIRYSLGVKAVEYVRNEDAMHNFNVGSKMTGMIREKVLYGFSLKHLISISDIRNDIEKGVLPTEKIVEEKYGDAINYLILEKASVLERIHKSKNVNN